MLLRIVPPGPHPGAKNTVFCHKLCLQAPTQHQKHNILSHKKEDASLQGLLQVKLSFLTKYVIFVVIYVVLEAKKNTVKHLLFEH